MKRIIFLLSILCCNGAYADTINIHWLNDDGTMYENTTCTVDGDLELPTSPTKTGYTFAGWELLPYIRIEYLESTGTQAIDTGYIPNQKSGINIDFYAYRPDKTSIAYVRNEEGFAFGVSQETSITSRAVFIASGARGDDNVWILAVDALYGGGTGRYTAIINKRNASISALNGQFLTHNFPDFSCINSFHLYLFATVTESGLNIGPSKIYSCKLYDNDILVRDFIPVLDGNGTPCMYDKVTKQFYYNQGTGQFIAGPVIGGE